MTMTQTESIVRLLRDVLGADVVGVYLHGSSVLGGRRFNSDLDVLAVSRQRTTADDRRALGDGLLKILRPFSASGPRPPDRVNRRRSARHPALALPTALRIPLRRVAPTGVRTGCDSVAGAQG